MPHRQDSNRVRVIKGGPLPEVEKDLVDGIGQSASRLAHVIGHRNVARQLRALADIMERAA